MGKSAEAKHTPQQELPLKNTSQTNETRNAVLQNTHPSLKCAPQKYRRACTDESWLLLEARIFKVEEKGTGTEAVPCRAAGACNQNGKDPTEHDVTGHFF